LGHGLGHHVPVDRSPQFAGAIDQSAADAGATAVVGAEDRVAEPAAGGPVGVLAILQHVLDPVVPVGDVRAGGDAAEAREHAAPLHAPGVDADDLVAIDDRAAGIALSDHIFLADRQVLAFPL